MVSAAAAEHALRAWRPTDAAQRGMREAFLGFLAARPHDACRRSCTAGHLTASAVLLDHDRQNVLLTLHPRVGSWVQLGGHCEPEDESLVHAALREAGEESGIDGLRIDPEPVRLDVHPITCSLGVPTRHFDVQFVVWAPAGARFTISDESDDLRWWPVGELPEGAGIAPGLVALARSRSLPRSGLQA